MPRFIVKPDPAEDFYVYWSTIVDEVIACGSRAELADWLTEYGGAYQVPHSVRFGRADRTGSSSLHGWYGWDVEEFSLGQYSERRYVRRENLAAYARALMSGGEDAAIVHTAPVSESAEFRSRFQPPADAPPALDGRIPDSGEGDDAAWLDAAPVGTVVRDAEADTWTKSGGPANGSWFLNGGRGGAGATFVASRGPLTVVSVPEPTATLHDCTVDETAGDAEIAAAVASINESFAEMNRTFAAVSENLKAAIEAARRAEETA